MWARPNAGQHASTMNLISPAEAHRAIYIDFEGRQKDPPSLLGVRWDADQFEQWVIEPALYSAADGSPKTKLRWPAGYGRFETGLRNSLDAKRSIETLGGIVETLVRRAEAENRL